MKPSRHTVYFVFRFSNFGIMMIFLIRFLPTRLLVFLCLVFVCFAVPPQLVDKKLWFVNETVLNVDSELAVFQMEFDQDLYLSGETFLCGEAEKVCPTPDCIPCDWSSQQVFFSFFLVLSCWFREWKAVFCWKKKISIFFAFFLIFFLFFVFV